jgi:hypothetical protein
VIQCPDTCIIQKQIQYSLFMKCNVMSVQHIQYSLFIKCFFIKCNVMSIHGRVMSKLNECSRTVMILENCINTHVHKPEHMMRVPIAN